LCISNGRDAKHFATEDDLDTLADAQERLEVLQELYSLILDYFKSVVHLLEVNPD
jgi:hypothetical protein